MINVKRDFNDRASEIELYFQFIENVEQKDAKLIYPDETRDEISSDLNKIFKANSFLLLYNLCESCIKGAIEAIYNTLGREVVSYDDLREEVKTEIVNFLRNKINTATFITRTSHLATDIILNCFDKEQLLSGNLDARKVKDLASRYGFSHSTTFLIDGSGTRKSIDTNNLLIVKKNRNDLAHGTFSFKECGKDYSVLQLMEVKNHVLEYLKQILDNIERYIINQEYLTPQIL